MSPRTPTKLMALLLLAMACSVPAQARVFAVNTTDDTADAAPGDGICADANGSCSLRAAVMEANTGVAVGGDRVDVPGGLYRLTLGPIDVTATMTINGTGSSRAVVEGDTPGTGLFALGSVLYAKKLFQGTDSVTGTPVPKAVVTSTDAFENCLQAEGCLGKVGLVDAGGVSPPTPIHPISFDFSLSAAEQAAVTGNPGLGVLRVEAARDIGRKLGATGADVVTATLEGVGMGDLFYDTIDTCVRFHNESPIDFDCGPNFNNDKIAGASQTLPDTFVQAAAGDGNVQVVLSPVSYTPTSDVGRIKVFSVELLYLKYLVVTLKSLTVQGGSNSAIYNNGAVVEGFDLVVKDSSAPVGGGFWNQFGGLRLRDTTIAGNTAFTGGGIYNAVLGAVYLDRCTVSDNRADVQSGGGILNYGILELTNSTISGNLARLGGGGVQNQGALAVNFSTISDNSANLDLSQNFNPDAVGGGIANVVAGRVNLSNSILAGNRDGRASGLPFPPALVSPDCFDVAVAGGAPLRNFLSSRDNLVGVLNASCDFRDGDALVSGLPFDHFGSEGTPLDPGIGPLADNGGFTRTHALEPGSPAINGDLDASAPSVNCPSIDQRRFRRPGDSPGDTICDIGAYESGGLTAIPEDPLTRTSPVTVTFTNITQPGVTRLDILSSGPPPAAGFMLGNPPVYYEISTTTTFTPPMTVCIDYSGITFPGGVIQLMHYEDTNADGAPDTWVNRTVSVDTNKKVICAQVDSFSLFGVFERINRPPQANAGPDRRVECDGGTPVTLDGSASSDPDGDALGFEWKDAAGLVVGTTSAVSLVLPPGASAFTLTVTDPAGLKATDGVVITVLDTSRPVISRISARPDVLWPPHNKLVPVTVEVSVADRCDAATACRIVSVTSNEPCSGHDRSPDWQIVSDLAVNLRAERSDRGRGRTYTITVECRDASGNLTRGTVMVKVPHDRR